MSDRARELISVVVAVRDEEKNVPYFADAMKAVLETLPYDWDVIFVEDSSRDATVAALETVCAADNRFSALVLSRGFGHHVAVTAGIDHACGDHIITMDSDFEHPPAFLPAFFEYYSSGFDIVYALRSSHRTFIKEVGSRITNALMTRLADEPIELNSSGFRIFSARVAAAVRSMPERRRTMPGLLSWPGFKVGHIVYQPGKRLHGETKYPLVRTMELAITSVTSFSVKPLRFGIYLGLLSSVASFLVGMVYIFGYLTGVTTVEGFTALIVAIFFMGGLILLVLGIVGEYIATIFLEVKSRPLYLIKHTIRGDRRDSV